MSYLNDISVIITEGDLEEIKIRHYSEMKQKYMLVFGDIALWFINHDDLQKFSLGVQSEFEKTMIKDRGDTKWKNIK